MADMAMAELARVINGTTKIVPTAGWSVRQCLPFFVVIIAYSHISMCKYKCTYK